jgi:molybdenum-dependent DNA-binding transcriptional regulator ModE
VTRRRPATSLNWNLLKAFMHTAEHGSFAAAARAAGVQRPTVSEKMGRLEQELGVRLIDRRAGSGSLALTPHGQRLRRMLVEFEKQLAALACDDPVSTADRECAGILRDVDEAWSALERVRAALRKT